jgi:hypothetical protein
MVEVGSCYILWERRKNDIFVAEIFLKPPSMNGLSRQCGIIDVSQLYRPSRPVSGIVLLFCVVFFVCNVCFIVCVALCAVFCFVLDRLCGLVVTVPGYRSRGPNSIPGATRFSGK